MTIDLLRWAPLLCAVWVLGLVTGALIVLVQAKRRGLLWKK